MSLNERELRAMVARGALPGRGRGAGLKIRMGDYDDAFGRRTGITSSEDWLWYRVVPDEEAEEAEAERRGLREILSILDWQPLGESADPELQNVPHRIRTGLREGIAYQMIVCWVEVGMVEMVSSRSWLVQFSAYHYHQIVAQMPSRFSE